MVTNTPTGAALWLAGARPKTLPAAIVPVAVGTAAVSDDVFILWRALAAMVVALALQVATNYANDYSDGIRGTCLLYTSPSPRDKRQSRMPSSA